MQIVYRLIVFVLGIIGAAAALGINLFYSASTRFQGVVGLHPDASHGWLGLGCAILGFIGAFLLLFRVSIPAGAVLLVIAGIGFFFVVNWWALLASPQMLIAAFFALYYYFSIQRERALRQQISQGRMQTPERPPPEPGAPAVG
ncbi:MAG TPA: hypothetical protein VKT82_28045 [Ktedonobacterales bacterium]|nr:hypothetical protein [Ktedonobacterales bacterium]